MCLSAIMQSMNRADGLPQSVSQQFGEIDCLNGVMSAGELAPSSKELKGRLDVLFGRIGVNETMKVINWFKRRVPAEYHDCLERYSGKSVVIREAKVA